MKTVLIIDDEVKLRSLLSRIIAAEGFEVLEAGNAKTGLKLAAQSEIDVILCDVKLPDGNGVSLVPLLKTANPSAEIVLLTAYGNIADGVQAMKNGAFDYLVKGDDNDKIIPLISRAVEKSQLQKKVSQLEQMVGKKYSFSTILGTSKAILTAVDLAKKVAPLDTPVLLTGETGTGKEVFAQAIHQSSGRASKNIMALNCSTFGKENLESELFGYKQGAFTGAVKDKKGLIEEAHQGTLFLDEIGELPLELQAKLLRVLETQEFIKLGDTKPVKTNFRLIAATNRNLQIESEEKRFRSDLYYRLNVFQIQLPPLRDRIRDIEALTQYYVDFFANQINKRNLRIDPEFLDKMQQYTWPGNIRELRNVIERSVILSDNILLPESLPFDIQQAQHSNKNNTMSAFSINSVEKLHIQKVLNFCKGNKAETARLLEIGIATLYRKLEEYGISSSDK